MAVYKCLHTADMAAVDWLMSYSYFVILVNEYVTEHDVCYGMWHLKAYDNKNQTNSQ